MNKQTNNHFLDPKYLIQIKSDLQKLFREIYCGHPRIFKTKKQINKQTNKKNKKTFF